MKSNNHSWIWYGVFIIVVWLVFILKNTSKPNQTITPIDGGVDITFNETNTIAPVYYFYMVLVTIFLGSMAVLNSMGNYKSEHTIRLMIEGVIWVLLLLWMLTVIGCDDTGSPYAKISSGIIIKYSLVCPDPNNLPCEYKDWMLDDWKNSSQEDLTNMYYSELHFYIYLKDTYGSIIKEPGTKYGTEVVGHYDMNGWTPGGIRDKWESVGYIESYASDDTGASLIIVGLGDRDLNNYWTGATATFVDIKLGLPMAPWTSLYLNAAFLDEYPTDLISFESTLTNSCQDVHSQPVSNFLMMGNTGTTILPCKSGGVTCDFSNDDEMPMEMDSGYIIDPNEYSNDPNLNIYCRWSRIIEGQLTEIDSFSPAYAPMPYIGPEPNQDPNECVWLDPNSEWYKFVQTKYIDPSYITGYNPLYCAFQFALPDGMEAPEINPLATSTVYLRSLDQDGRPLIVMPIKIRYSYTYENKVTGITQPIVPNCWWVYSDWMWTYGQVGDMALISLKEFGTLDIQMPHLYGDFNLDNRIDIEDLSMMPYFWLGNVSTYPSNYELMADVNIDGVIDYSDLAAMWR